MIRFFIENPPLTNAAQKAVHEANVNLLMKFATFTALNPTQCEFCGYYAVIAYKLEDVIELTKLCEFHMSIVTANKMIERII